MKDGKIAELFVTVFGAVSLVALLSVISPAVIFFVWNWMPVNANRQITPYDAVGAWVLISLAGSTAKSSK